MIRSLPPANCTVCGSLVRAITYSTFSYWYCDKCKDECDVWLKTVIAPKGEVYAGMPKEPGDISISQPGVYSISYHDGQHEWYEHKPRSRDIRLSGTYVQSATRITDRDMPSRKRVQPLSKAGEGTSDEGLCIRAVSGEADSILRYGQAVKIDLDDCIFPAEISGQSSSSLPGSNKAQVPDMAQSNQLLQHGSVPPDDTL